MEIILISIRQFRDSFFKEPTGETFVTLSLLRETNTEFKNEIEHFWLKIQRGFIIYVVSKVREKIDAADSTDDLEDKKISVVDLVSFLSKEGRFVVNNDLKIARVVFLELKRFILKNSLPLNEEFRKIFPSAPELTKDLKWKSEYRFRPLEQ